MKQSKAKGNKNEWAKQNKNVSILVNEQTKQTSKTKQIKAKGIKQKQKRQSKAKHKKQNKIKQNELKQNNRIEKSNKLYFM